MFFISKEKNSHGGTQEASITKPKLLKSTGDDGSSQSKSSNSTTLTLLKDECLTGIEHLLSVKIIKKTHANRVECSNAVLSMSKIDFWYHNVGVWKRKSLTTQLMH